QRVDVDNEMQSLEAKVVKYKTQQMEVKKNEEYQALTHEIEGLQVRIGELEEREIELLVQFDDDTVVANTAETEHREQISIFEKEIARLKAQEADVKAQIGQASADVDSAREGVPTDWLKAYQRAQQRRARPQWVVPMQDQHCGGCHLKVSAEVEGKVLTDKEPAFCDSCGRMLYKP
ncbi:MAG: C4-type zinc ribbon domain-containing protein, partial [Verrucomicrobiota bacterium]